MSSDYTPVLGEGANCAQNPAELLACYGDAGFNLIRIQKNNGKPTKGPTGIGWNLPHAPGNPNGYTTNVDRAAVWLRAGDNIGLALLPSGVVSLDIDDLDETRRIFTELGLPIDEWLNDPRRVEIRSGKPGKAKLLFRAAAHAIPPTRKLTFGRGKEQRSIFELRHGSADGQTLQDVLPPSIHPDTGKPYTLVGEVVNMPTIPPELLALWVAWPDELLKSFAPDYELPPEVSPPTPKHAPIAGERNSIDEFNAAHDLETLLEGHGYRRKGRRYLRPGSESGLPGVALLDGHDGRKLCYSHGADDLNDGHAHDAFDVYRLLRCGGDWKQALAWNPDITAHNRRLFAESRNSAQPEKPPADDIDGQNDALPELLQNLSVKLSDDPFYPFQPAVLRALVRLEENDALNWNKVRATLKTGKVVLKDLGAAMAKDRAKLHDERLEARRQQAKERQAADNDKSASGAVSLFDDEGNPKSQATVLIELAGQWEVFHDTEKVGYIVIVRSGIREVWPIRSAAFRLWLSGAFYQLADKGCNGNAIADALNTIEARAIHSGKESTIHLRVARKGDHIYLDLCDEKWRVLEISPEGWRILDQSPVYFVRKKGMAPLPIPVKGGLVAELRKFLNIDDGHFELVVGWLLGALRGKGPFPSLVLQGEQGTGKSTTCRALRSFVDPSTVPLRSPPREVRDLLVSAVNNHLVVLDNLSGLTPEISDCLCRFATGGGLDARALFTDMEQVLIDIQRPVLVNGIDDIATRPDLSERSIILNLPVIDATQRRDERSFWAEFDVAKPRIMGALLDALSCALRQESSVTLLKKPRMADFALWVVAAEPALGWETGAFISAYDQNQEDAVEAGIEASPVGSTLLVLLGDCPEWRGSPTELLNVLSQRAGNLAKAKTWPQSTKGLKNELNRLAPSLRRLGVTVNEGRNGIGRFYTITKVAFKAS